MLNYALDLSDLKTRSWFRSSLDQGSHEKIHRVGVLAEHKITGISMKRLHYSRHMRNGIPTMGFMIRSQLAGFQLKPGQITQVRDRQGNRVTDFNWRQKNMRPRSADEKSLYVLNGDELEGLIEAGGYGDQYKFMRSLRQELKDQVYERSTELELIKFKSYSASKDSPAIGVENKANKKKGAPVWFTGVMTSEVCPKFSKKMTDNDFTDTINLAFEDMVDQREQTKQPEPADVTLVADQPQLMNNYIAKSPEKLANSAYSYQAGQSDVSKEMMNQLNATLTSDTEHFQNSANPYATNALFNSASAKTTTHSNSFRTGISNSSNSYSKHITSTPLKLRSQLNLGTSVVNSEISSANNNSAVRDNKKHITRKPLSLSQEIDLRNDTISYASGADDEDEDEDSNTTSSASSMASSEEDEEESSSSRRSSLAQEANSNTTNSEDYSSESNESNDDVRQSNDSDKYANNSLKSGYMRDSKAVASSERVQREHDLNSGSEAGPGF